MTHRVGYPHPTGHRRWDYGNSCARGPGPLAELQMPGPIHPVGVEAFQFREQVGTNHPRSTGHRIRLEVDVALPLVGLGIRDHRYRRSKRVESPAGLLQRPTGSDHLGPNHPSVDLHRPLD